MGLIAALDRAEECAKRIDAMLNAPHWDSHRRSKVVQESAKLLQHLATARAEANSDQAKDSGC